MKTIYGYDELGRLKTVGSGNEVSTYNYDAVGNRDYMEIDTGGAAGYELKTDYEYNNLNRLTDVINMKTSVQLWAFHYGVAADGMRRQVDESVNEERAITYSYDKLNRVTGENAVETSTSTYGYTAGYIYDLAGNRLLRGLTLTQPSADLYTQYEYDAKDRLIRESHSESLARMFERQDGPFYAHIGADGLYYTAAGDPARIGQFRAWLMGLPSVWSKYLLAAILALIPLTSFGPVVARFIRRLRAGDGQAEAVRVHLALWQRCLCVMFAYMMLLSPGIIESSAQGATLYSQLATDTWATAGDVFSYWYDANGSLVYKISADVANIGTMTEADVLDYIGTYSPAYEHHVYNLQNRLTRIERYDDTQTLVDAVDYKYDASGIRVAKAVNGGSVTTYLIDPQNHTGYAQVLAEFTDGVLSKTYTIGDDIIAERTGSTSRYLMYDGQGSTRQLVSSTGVVLDTYSYDAYGVMLGGNPTPASPAATNLLYAGEQFDTAAPQYYLRARYYDPLNGRFTQMDPYAGNNEDPQSLHKYLYCHANPTNSVDPSGEIGLLQTMISTIDLAIIKAMDFAPTIAAYAWAVTKVAGLVWLGSLIYRELEMMGWVAETGVTDEIVMISGAVFFAGFILTGLLHSVPSPRGKVPYGSTHLSKQVQATRQVQNFSNARNGAAFEYRANDGSLRTVIRFSQRGVLGGGHAERVIAKELEAMGVSPLQVTNIYSELEPCNNPGGYCMPFLQKEFPQANVSWSFDYANEISREASRDAWLAAIKGLF